MVVGAGDGAIYALQPRTGKTIWKYQASTRGLNTTSVIDENGIVYGSHAEKNANDTKTLGAIFAFDGNTEGDISEDKLLWKIPGKAVGRNAPVKLGGRVYFVDDGASLVIVDAKTGELIGKKKANGTVEQMKLGRTMFGSPVAGDGKIYVAENSGRFHVLKPNDTGVEKLSEVRLSSDELVFGSPIIANGRIYLPTIDALYCIGKPGAATVKATTPKQTGETSADKDKVVAQIMLTPVELLLLPGQKANLQVRGYNRHGQLIQTMKDVEITVAGGGTIGKDHVYRAPASGLAAVVLTAKSGEMTATARIRVIPMLPWKFDFSDDKVPPVWIGADYRHKPAPLDGEKGLVKISTIPKGTRSQAWLGWTNLHDYTIQADFNASQKNGRIPDLGLINQRYTLDLQGAQHLQIRSWTARAELRFAKTIDFTWSADTWYTMKFQSETKDGKAILRGKVWPRSETEPKEWQIEAADATPNLNGSPGLFGNSTDGEFFIDNVQVTAN